MTGKKDRYRASGKRANIVTIFEKINKELNYWLVSLTSKVSKQPGRVIRKCVDEY